MPIGCRSEVAPGLDERAAALVGYRPSDRSLQAMFQDFGRSVVRISSRAKSAPRITFM
jgi:hypothetical protein